MTPPAKPTTRQRIVVSLAAAIWGVLWVLRDLVVEQSLLTDFDQIWYAARAVLDGTSPYAIIGPGRLFPLEYEFYYPLPAVLIALPLGALPLQAARITFVAISSALFTWAFLGVGWFRWPALLSISFIISAAAAQWTPLLLAATLWPALAWILVAKPNVALAMAPAGSSRQRWVALIGGAVVCALAFIVDPSWISKWLSAVRSSTHFQPLVLHLTAGGPLLLLALLRWRRPEARLLLAFAIVPHTTALYETLALYLVALSRRETMLLALCTAIAFFWQGAVKATSAAYLMQLANIILITTYLPALALVLRRPNEGPAPNGVERLVQRWPSWIRGRALSP